ncbi:MAG: hypothetical protein IMZ53_02095 [Thermoplasmata archaeon]|nr:hypothetical protein [Thermoplasmata archaeon]MBE3139353.1 hypothetical protein [Thermoplasmata archaeon]
MVSLKKKNINGNTYYYIEHSFRKNGKVEKKRKITVVSAMTKKIRMVLTS